MTTEMYHLIADRFRGKISEEDLIQLEKWRTGSKENEQIYRDLEKVWKLSGPDEQPLNFDVEKEWDAFENLRKSNDNATRTIPRFSMKQFYRYAAIVIPFILLAGALLFTQYRNNNQWQTIQADNQAKHVILPDQSEVWLNKNTSIRFAELTGKRNREAYLQGEAFFHVRKTGGRFTVYAGGTGIQVLGTRFNVKTGKNVTETQVYVEEGKVRFAETKHRSNYIDLQAGEKAVYKGRNIAIQKLNATVNSAAWVNRRLSFSNNKLMDVVQDIQNYFHVTIKISPEMEHCLFSGSFDDPVLDNVMEVIALSTGTKISYTNDSIVLEGPGCKE